MVPISQGPCYNESPLYITNLQVSVFACEEDNLHGSFSSSYFMHIF